MTASDVEFAIIGGGAAGIAAARLFAAEGRSYVIIEASGLLGGRCVSKTSATGLVYDVGAHFLHMPDLNPLYALGAVGGFDVYRSSNDHWLQRNRREASAAEYDALDQGWTRMDAAVFTHPRSAPDISCADLIPKDLGRWQQTLEFIVGPYLCGRDLDEVSAHDFATSDEREDDGFCREGFGRLLAYLGHGLDVRLACPVRRIARAKDPGLEISTAGGTLRAAATLVTVSTAVLASGAIDFAPGLPDDLVRACAGLPLGSYERVIFTLGGNPLGASADSLIFAHTTAVEGAALLARVGGTDLAMLDVGGRVASGLAKAGPDAMMAFAHDWLKSTFGGYAAKQFKPIETTSWCRDPLTLGSFSSANIGMMSARQTLRDYRDGHIWFAGEATHASLWGTVAGAWESGEQAARDMIRHIRP